MQNFSQHQSCEWKTQLEKISSASENYFSRIHQVREESLKLSREIIRNSAVSIRASHRSQFDQAKSHLTKSEQKLTVIIDICHDTPEIYHSRFIQDAQKEYVEASLTLAFLTNSSLPELGSLSISPAAYLNGLSESVGELRRFILDQLRQKVSLDYEKLLVLMDDIYTLLATIDYPDAITNNLRRNTDIARSIMEKTRGDLTAASINQTLSSPAFIDQHHD